MFVGPCVLIFPLNQDRNLHGQLTTTGTANEDNQGGAVLLTYFLMLGRGGRSGRRNVLNEFKQLS